MNKDPKVTFEAKQFIAGIKQQASSGVYAEHDDTLHFQQHHWVKDESIRQRILIERAIVRRMVRDILQAGGGAYCVSIYDGEDYPLKRSRDLDAIMADIGQCDEETIVVRHVTKPADGGEKLGSIYLVYGNDGWDVIADHTASHSMDELLAGANQMSDAIGDALAQ